MRLYTKTYLSEILLFIVGILILTGVFKRTSVISSALQIEQYAYYGIYILLLGVVLLCDVFLHKRHVRIKDLFSFVDILVLSFLAIIAVTYQWNLNPAPERLLFLFQMGVLWYLLRMAMFFYPILSFLWLIVFMVLGGIQAFIGIFQLYGLAYSNHSLFRLTGTFFNPGPYCGYLAMALPVCIYLILHYQYYRKETKWCGMLHNLTCVCAVLISMLLLVGVSRTAWFAAVLSSVWVLLKEKKQTVKSYFEKNRLLFVVSGISCLVLILILLTVSFKLKEDSANGRLFLWKIDLMAWQNSFTGSGVGGFPAIYGDTQSDYFANNHYSQKEELVAGTPAYAFNEYLQVLVEHSVWGIFVMLLWIILIFRNGYKNRRIGWLGVLISLFIFSFASYPLQLPVFIVVMLFAASGCLAHNRQKEINNRRKSFLNRNVSAILVLILLSINGGISYSQKRNARYYRQWEISRQFYTMKAYERAADSYKELYANLKHQPDFLFEYGQSLSKIRNYHSSNEVLRRGTQLSADPMFWNIIGKNYQVLKKYEKAEECFIHAIHILPNRVYPYYLLTKLYADPNYYNEIEIRKIGQILLEKEPKVESTAIKQMKNEIRELIKEPM